MDNVIQLTDEWGCCIHSCANDETVCDGRDLAPWQHEAVLDTLLAGDKVLSDHLTGATSDSDTCFRNWNGGKHSHSTIHKGLFVANFCRRVIEDYADGKPTWSAWEWVSKVPSVLLLGLETIMEKADAAARKVLNEWESRVARGRAVCGRRGQTDSRRREGVRDE